MMDRGDSIKPDMNAESISSMQDTVVRNVQTGIVESQPVVNGSVNLASGDKTDESNNLFLYSPGIDPNAIWKANQDIKRSFSVPSHRHYVDSLNDDQDILSSIWNYRHNSNEALVGCDETGKEKQSLPHISVDVGSYDLFKRQMRVDQNLDKYETFEIRKDSLGDSYSAEDRKKILSMINSHDGWGVKPVNQKTPWEIPDSGNDGDSYPDTFSNWLNETGTFAWEAYETTRRMSDWSGNTNATSSNFSSNLNTFTRTLTDNAVPTVTQASFNKMTNESIWSNGGGVNVFNSINSSKNNRNVDVTIAPHDVNISNGYGTPRTDYGSLTNDQLRNSYVIKESRSMIDYKMKTALPQLDQVVNRKNKTVETDLQKYRYYKDTQKQIIEQYQKEQRKLMEVENSIGSISKIPDPQSRAILNELVRQRQIVQNRLHASRVQLETINVRLIPLEENFNRSISSKISLQNDKQFPRSELHSMTNSSSFDMLANKMSSMQVQPNPDFRLDVPEFVPGKKWYGLSQNGKENRNPTFSKIGQSYLDGFTDFQNAGNTQQAWLFVQNLPPHINGDMIQSLLMHQNIPCILPIHVNPFSMWMLVKFPSQVSSQQAFQLLSGKVGMVSLISEQDANFKLQELKDAMATFVAHQN